MSERKEHWEKVYLKKKDEDTSWFEPVPETSIYLIKKYCKPGNSVIDVGGGNSTLAFHLNNKGYEDVTVLDISRAGIQRNKSQFANESQNVNWIVSDVLQLDLNQKFHCWHDRATFHFLKTREDVEQYIEVLLRHLESAGYLILSTFSDTGPEKCSGLEVTQYTVTDLVKEFYPEFAMIKHLSVTHTTPFDTQQDFIYTVFQNKT